MSRKESTFLEVDLDFVQLLALHFRAHAVGGADLGHQVLQIAHDDLLVSLALRRLSQFKVRSEPSQRGSAHDEVFLLALTVQLLCGSLKLICVAERC